MALVKCAVCKEMKFLEATGACLSERCNPLARQSADAATLPEPERVPEEQVLAGESCPTCGQKVSLRAELKKSGKEGEYEKVKKERQRRE